MRQNYLSTEGDANDEPAKQVDNTENAVDQPNIEESTRTMIFTSQANN